MILSSPGVFTERIYLYLADGLTPCPQALEKHEVIEVHWMALREAVAMAHDGRINDAKSVIGLLRGSADQGPASQAVIQSKVLYARLG